MESKFIQLTGFDIHEIKFYLNIDLIQRISIHHNHQKNQIGSVIWVVGLEHSIFSRETPKEIFNLIGKL
jgi:hypothetical protein